MRKGCFCAGFFVLVLAGLMAADLAWAVFRERHLADLVRERNQASLALTQSLSLGTTTVKMSLDGVADDLREVQHRVVRAEELSETHRQEIIRLVVDVEQRITNAIWASRNLQTQPAIVNQVSSGQAAANQAGEIRNG